MTEFRTSFVRFRYLLKADDDAFVNIAALRGYLAARSRRRRRAIVGYLMKGFRPNRNRASKWFTSPQLFAKARLPDFVSGFAYVVTRDAVEASVRGRSGGTHLSLRGRVRDRHVPRKSARCRGKQRDCCSRARPGSTTTGRRAGVRRHCVRCTEVSSPSMS
ncbi:hypothetical protein HPB51_014449 [Rhipicephalus microplus]|uniref:Hexosyltransferase n=1 Tax=Rhipicephalus microplus TaxID=6941 RepID=A0A9J6D5H8_RHIMP|nr:hypothetical protein HPB51_014449 [Rhipicephalus microplus]